MIIIHDLKVVAICRANKLKDDNRTNLFETNNS